MLKNNRKSSFLLSSPYLAWAIIFILVPIAMVFWYGLTDTTGTFTFANIAAITQPEHWKALWLAVELALISTVICFLLAYPLGLILARNKMSSEGILTTLIILPMWMNFLLRTLSWVTLLENRGVLNSILSALHLPTLQIINTPAAIVVGMVYDFLPFMILPIYNALAKIDDEVLNAAQDLGANKFQTLMRVTLPLSLPGIMSGVTMVFIPSLTTFAISSMLGGSKILLIGNVIEQEFILTYDWHLGSGLSLILMIFIVINMVISMISEKQED